MLSRIKESRPYDFISIQHLGEILQNKEKIYENQGMFENYTFNEKDGKTEVLVDLDASDTFPPEFVEMFTEMWPKGLEKLKELAEK
jgi:hypothetical protein